MPLQGVLAFPKPDEGNYIYKDRTAPVNRYNKKALQNE